MPKERISEYKYKQQIVSDDKIYVVTVVKNFIKNFLPQYKVLL